MKLRKCEYFGTSGLAWHQGGLSVAATRYEPEQVQPWHTHERPTFFVQMRGDHIDECHRQSWEQPALSVSYHPVDSPHRSAIGPRPLIGINIEIDGAWLDAHAIPMRTLGCQRIVTGDSSALTGIRLAESVGFGPDSPFEVGDLVLDLVAEFSYDDSGQSDVKPIWLPGIEENLRADYRSGVTVRELAAFANVHPVHLARTFRRHYHCSISDFKTRLRLVEVARLVMSDGLTLGEAALEAGFHDQFHLSRKFKQEIGFRPVRMNQVLRRCQVANVHGGGFGDSPNSVSCGK